MKLTVIVSRPWRKDVPPIAPRFYRKAYRVEGRHADVWAIPPVHWILAAWYWWGFKRWILEDVFFSIGWMEGDHPHAPSYESLRFGNPAAIVARRVVADRGAARDAREYAIRRAHAEGAAEGYTAHVASFSALQRISMLTRLEGEVDDYDEVVKAVEELLNTKPAQLAP